MFGDHWVSQLIIEAIYQIQVGWADTASVSFVDSNIGTPSAPSAPRAFTVEVVFDG
jgi:hypothetical protein